MKIGFIGAGSVASALGRFLSDAGHEVLYISRNYKSAQRLADLSGGTAFQDYSGFLANTGMVWITTPDDAIKTVAEQLSSYDLSGITVCHTSGVHSSAILSSLKARGVHTVSCHPSLPFSGTPDIKKALFTVEGDIDAVCALLDENGLRYAVIDGQDKALYHAALCMASNYMVTLAAAAFDMLARAGMSNELISELLYPLMEQNLKNMTSGGIKNALTGPVSRGDTGTVEKHLQVLGKEDDLYRVLLFHTAILAYDTGRIDEKTKDIFNTNITI